MAVAWWDDYFNDVDSFDINRVAAWFDDDIELRFANWPAQQGKEAVKAAFTDFWGHLKGLSHQNHAVLEQDGRVCTEADVTFVRQDGREVEARAATIFHRSSDKITALHVYIDVSPVFAA